MALYDDFPAYAHITELQLSIGMALGNSAGGRPLTGSRAPGAPLTEVWQGQVAFAALSAADHRAFVGYLEKLDGKTNTFALPLKGGFASQNVAATATTTAAPVSGAGALAVTFGSAVDLLPGTLIAIGNYLTDTFQLVELLDAVSGSGAKTLNISPRIRRTFPIGTVVTFGTVKGVFRLAGDTLAQSATLDHGTVTLDIIEAL